MPSVTVKGMSCGHCKKSVTEALSKIEGVENVDVNLESGTASWEEKAPVDTAVIKKAITDIGFEVE